jgi:hypothetical protein
VQAQEELKESIGQDFEASEGKIKLIRALGGKSTIVG